MKTCLTEIFIDDIRKANYPDNKECMNYPDLTGDPKLNRV